MCGAAERVAVRWQHTDRCMNAIRLMLIVSTVGLISACEGLGAGGCVHEFRDPLLRLQTATDSVTGRAIPRVAITNVSVDNHAFATSLVLTQLPNTRVTLIADTLWCDVACGFGNMEGVWRFDLSAPGYRAQTFQLTARYARFDGGCPSFNAGSTSLTARLRSLTTT